MTREEALQMWQRIDGVDGFVVQQMVCYNGEWALEVWHDETHITTQFVIPKVWALHKQLVLGMRNQRPTGYRV